MEKKTFRLGEVTIVKVASNGQKYYDVYVTDAYTLPPTTCDGETSWRCYDDEALEELLDEFNDSPLTTEEYVKLIINDTRETTETIR
jgi:hypothetical protein